MRDSVKVDFLQSHDRTSRRHTLIWAIAFMVLVGSLSAVGAGASYRAAKRGTPVLSEIGHLPLITDVRELIQHPSFPGAKDSESIPDKNLRILLLGIGGPGHEGGLLTDTIMLASVDQEQERVSLLSIPRDLAYPLGGGKFEKINAVNAYAEQEQPGQGAILTAEALSKLFNTRIDHVVRLDFKGFEKFIDAIGGVDINVERSFTDPQYPAPHDAWQTVSFKKGSQHMNGAKALIFARSRHGNNGEAGDFARSRRQQLVLAAVRDKLFSLGVLGNPTKIADLWNVVSSNIQTDLSAWDLIKLAPFAAHFDQSRMVTRVLTNDADGELTNVNLEGAGYMLFPKKQDWSEIRDIVANPFRTKEEIAAQERPTAEVRVEIKNGTIRTGFAAQVAETLKQRGYVVTGTGNAVQRGYDHTVIFDLTGGKKSDELVRLKKILNATMSTATPSSTTSGSRIVYGPQMNAEPISSTSTEFFVILGDSSLGLVSS